MNGMNLPPALNPRSYGGPDYKAPEEKYVHQVQRAVRNIIGRPYPPSLSHGQQKRKEESIHHLVQHPALPTVFPRLPSLPLSTLPSGISKPQLRP